MADAGYDVIVIGAGVEGSATAYQLTRLAKEKRIALVEQVFTTQGVAGESVGGRVVHVPFPPANSLANIFNVSDIGPRNIRIVPKETYILHISIMLVRSFHLTPYFFSLMPTTLVAVPMEGPG